MHGMSEPEQSEKRTRAAHRLSAVKVTKLKSPGLYEDGAGLALIITDNDTKRWARHLTINGQRVERGLGVDALAFKLSLSSESMVSGSMPRLN